MALTDLLRTQREGQRFQASNLREGPMHMKKLTGSGRDADFVSAGWLGVLHGCAALTSSLDSSVKFFRCPTVLWDKAGLSIVCLGSRVV